MTLEEFIVKNPTKEQIAERICAIANNNVLNFNETYVWEELSKLGGFTEDDFWDDQEETIRVYGEREAVEIYGLKNWKLRNTTKI